MTDKVHHFNGLFLLPLFPQPPFFFWIGHLNGFHPKSNTFLVLLLFTTELNDSSWIFIGWLYKYNNDTQEKKRGGGERMNKSKDGVSIG
jgi:hypothetical protein